jgi:hypothetical protein
MNVKAVSTQEMRVARRRPVALLYLAGLLLLVLLGVILVTSAPAPVTVGAVSQPLTGDRFLAANPELVLFRHTRASAATASEASFLAQNPELSGFRYARAVVIDDASFLAQNPELLVFRRMATTTASPLAAEPGLAP